MVFHGVNPTGRQKKRIGRRHKKGKSYHTYKTACAAEGLDADISNSGEPNPTEAGTDPEAEPDPAEPADPTDPPPVKKPRVDGNWRLDQTITARDKQLVQLKSGNCDAVKRALASKASGEKPNRVP